MCKEEEQVQLASSHMTSLPAIKTSLPMMTSLSVVSLYDIIASLPPLYD